jgi:enoyl-CoA hydratase/carnithine racemase
MNYISISQDAAVATVTVNRGKVNALNPQLVAELSDTFNVLQADPDVAAVILTGHGKFFSFGFDIPEFLPYSQEDFTQYLHQFTDLYTRIFLFPKPVVAALNGHTMAGGCMLAAACDTRLMLAGKPKIALNEITFGATVLAGATEMLTHAVGSKNAAKILYSGALFSPEEALSLGLIDRVCPDHESLITAAHVHAQEMAGKAPAAFSSIKALLRQPIGQRMRQREVPSIQEFVKIWYADQTRVNLAKITIQS